MLVIVIVLATSRLLRVLDSLLEHSWKGETVGLRSKRPSRPTFSPSFLFKDKEIESQNDEVIFSELCQDPTSSFLFFKLKCNSFTVLSYNSFRYTAKWLLCVCVCVYIWIYSCHDKRPSNLRLWNSSKVQKKFRGQGEGTSMQQY